MLITTTPHTARCRAAISILHVNKGMHSDTGDTWRDLLNFSIKHGSWLHFQSF